MAGKKTVGIVLLAVGIVVLILSLLADPIGIGNSLSFGSYQILGTIVGVIAAAGGFVLAFRP
jgi:hypothetical protein